MAVLKCFDSNAAIPLLKVHVEVLHPDSCSCLLLWCGIRNGGARIRGFAWLYTIASRTTNAADRRKFRLQLRDESQREAR